MPVLDKVVAKSLNGYSPFLANEPQILFLEDGLNDVKALLHFAPVGEQRQHRPLLRDMSTHQKPLERVKVMGVGWLRYIACHVYRHVLIEVIARIELAGMCARSLARVQSHRILE